MSEIAEIVQVNITAESAQLSEQGFGTPLLIGYHAKWTDLYREYATDALEAALVSEGFETYHPMRLMAASIMRQSIKPAVVRVGRTAAPASGEKWRGTLTVPGTVAEGDVFSLFLRLLGAETPITYTAPSTPTSAGVATAVAALINAVSGFSSSATGSVITVTVATPGGVAFVRDPVKLTWANTTPTSAVYGTALDAIRAEDGGDDFYAVQPDNNAPALLDTLIEWTEPKTKVLLCHFYGTPAAYVTWLGTHESEHRTISLFAEQDYQYPCLEWATYGLARTPGSITWAFKALPGVNRSRLSTTDIQAIQGANGNTYRRIAGRDLTLFGSALSGRYFDIVHALDYLTARCGERVFGWIVSQDKVPYTDPSVDIVCGKVRAVLSEAVTSNILRANPAPTVTGPKVASVPQNVRETRVLPDVRFRAEFAGAIHKVIVDGTISF